MHSTNQSFLRKTILLLFIFVSIFIGFENSVADEKTSDEKVIRIGIIELKIAIPLDSDECLILKNAFLAYVWITFGARPMSLLKKRQRKALFRTS